MSAPAAARLGADRDARGFIRGRLPLRVVPDVPEVRLHLADAASGLNLLARLAGADFRAPYWAYVWAGGAALARHLLDHPEVVAGRRVFDLGTGSGLVAIAARLAGAGSVEAVDIDPLALVAAELNAAANRLDVAVRPGDALTAPTPEADLVCAGDVFYDTGVARASMAFLERCRAAGAKVLIGDPGRNDLPRHRLRVVERYSVRDFGGRDMPTDGAVFSLAG